ncbi:hypothetical protein Tco_0636835 [Tanacetum coccineum]
MWRNYLYGQGDRLYRPQELINISSGSKELNMRQRLVWSCLDIKSSASLWSMGLNLPKKNPQKAQDVSIEAENHQCDDVDRNLEKTPKEQEVVTDRGVRVLSSGLQRALHPSLEITWNNENFGISKLFGKLFEKIPEQFSLMVFLVLQAIFLIHEQTLNIGVKSWTKACDHHVVRNEIFGLANHGGAYVPNSVLEAKIGIFELKLVEQL